MGHLHIPNLYKDQTILLFREVFALEKIHGNPANVTWRDGRIRLSSGAASADQFARLFDQESLREKFAEIGHKLVTVFGEAHGGKQQGQAWRYGDDLKFVAFDVRIGESWLAVPQAENVVTKIGLEFVSYARVSTDLASLDIERDAMSIQANRNGIDGYRPREGVVLRPIVECTLNDGSRIIAKHKRDDERETKTPRRVVDPSKQVVLTEATAIAEEWVTPTRLRHVLDKIDGVCIESTPEVIAAMIEDIMREGHGEFVPTKEAKLAISRHTAVLFKQHLRDARKTEQV